MVFVSGLNKYFLFFLKFKCKGSKVKGVMSVSFNYISFCRLFCNFFVNLKFLMYIDEGDKWLVGLKVIEWLDVVREVSCIFFVYYFF